MQQSQSRPAKKNIRITCGRYLVRTIRRADVSERWAGWLSDPWVVHTLNLPARTLSKNELAEYVGRFDQRSNLLLGIFERDSYRHIGIIRFDYSRKLKQALVNILVGEPEHRGIGLMREVSIPLFDYVFEKTILEKVSATTLTRNALIISYLRSSGWKLDAGRSELIQSNAVGKAAELCCYSLTKDAWRAWKQTPVGMRAAQRVKTAEAAAMS